ncbi:MAG: acetolactate synthase small subunit [Actinomycetota bacterium]|nr:acetolactate synthase small subunit [Actinomycetota bacterium]
MSRDPRAQHHTLVVLVENKAGVLARVAGLFARRGFNITSLAVAPTDDESFSRITIVVDARDAPIEQITKQLFKLINVVKIQELAPHEAVARELMLVTVRADAQGRAAVLELVGIFGADVLNVGTNDIMISLDGSPAKLDDFEDLLRPLGISAIQRTGRVALPKLDRSDTRLRSVG